MHKILSLVLIIIVLFISGCMSPRLGYPVKTVEIPTPVIISATIAETGTIKTEIGFMADGIFMWSYGDYYKEQFSKIDTATLASVIKDRFTAKVLSLPDLFAVDPSVREKKPVEQSIVASESTDIASKYSLIFSVDEWGYWATQGAEREGPYVKVSIQLFDKETQATIWKYKSEAIEQVNLVTDRGDQTAAFLEKTYEKLILEQLDRYFKLLSAK
jgi:hypothetical protein